MATTPQTNVSLEDIAAILRDQDDIVICGHVSPDGDCIGGQLALWHALRLLGKRTTCVLVRPEPLGAALEFLPGSDAMVPAADYEGPCKTFVGVDVPNRDRIGAAACALLDKAEVSITIDHHASETRMCDYAYIDPDAAAASMLVWEVVKMLVAAPGEDSALCAYTGLLTDTGGFRFQNSDARAFHAAAEFVSYGVDPSYVAMNVYQNRSVPSLQLEAVTIGRLQVFCNGKAAISWVTEDDVRKAGASKADMEPLVDVVRSVQGILVACFMREQDGKARGNLRAKDDTDVSGIARKLGGGGHKAAAGFTLEMSLDDAIAVISEEIEGLLK